MISAYHIAWRFLSARKKSFTLTVAGVALGIGLFIVAQTQVMHLENLFVETVLEANGAIQVQDDRTNIFFENEKLVDHNNVFKGNNNFATAIDSFKGIESTTEVLEGKAELIHAFRSTPVDLYGVEAENYFSRSGFAKKLSYGKQSDFIEDPYSILLGISLAQKMGVSVGDLVSLSSGYERLNYRVAGLHQTGINDIDSSRIYLHLSEARKLLHQPHGVSHLQLSLMQPQSADFLADQIEGSLGFKALSWREREKLWLSLFKWMRWVALLLVIMVITVSGLGIFNNLTLLILQKERDIAILRAMGYLPQKIRQIFAFQGLVVYAFGLLIGVTLGYMGNFLLQIFPFMVEGLFQAANPPNPLSYEVVLLAAFWVGMVVFGACYFPARRASQVDPGKIIRSAAT